MKITLSIYVIYSIVMIQNKIFCIESNGNILKKRSTNPDQGKPGYFKRVGDFVGKVKKFVFPTELPNPNKDVQIQKQIANPAKTYKTYYHTKKVKKKYHDYLPLSRKTHISSLSTNPYRESSRRKELVRKLQNKFPSSGLRKTKILYLRHKPIYKTKPLLRRFPSSRLRKTKILYLRHKPIYKAKPLLRRFPSSGSRKSKIVYVRHKPIKTKPRKTVRHHVVTIKKHVPSPKLEHRKHIYVYKKHHRPSAETVVRTQRTNVYGHGMSKFCGMCKKLETIKIPNSAYTTYTVFKNVRIRKVGSLSSLEGEKFFEFLELSSGDRSGNRKSALEINFGKQLRLVGFVLKPVCYKERGDRVIGMLTAFKLDYRRDSNGWRHFYTYKGASSRKREKCSRRNERAKRRVVRLPRILVTNAIRIYPQNWIYRPWISMKIVKCRCS